jgi:hypothetical protein
LLPSGFGNLEPGGEGELSNNEKTDTPLEENVLTWRGLNRALWFIPSIDEQIDDHIRSLPSFGSPGEFRDKFPELVSKRIHPGTSTTADAVVAWVHRYDDDQLDGHETSQYFSLDDEVSELELWLMIVERQLHLCTLSSPLLLTAKRVQFFKDPLPGSRPGDDDDRSPEQMIAELWSIRDTVASFLESRFQSTIEEIARTPLHLDSRRVRPLTPESAPLAFEPEVRLLIMPAIQLVAIADDLQRIEERIAGA